MRIRYISLILLLFATSLSSCGNIAGPSESESNNAESTAEQTAAPEVNTYLQADIEEALKNPMGSIEAVIGMTVDGLHERWGTPYAVQSTIESEFWLSDLYSVVIRYSGGAVVKASLVLAIEAYIVEADDDILCIPKDDFNAETGVLSLKGLGKLPSGTISGESIEVEAGDLVRYMFDGSIAQSYPALIGDVIEVRCMRTVAEGGLKDDQKEQLLAKYESEYGKKH